MKWNVTIIAYLSLLFFLFKYFFVTSFSFPFFFFFIELEKVNLIKLLQIINKYIDREHMYNDACENNKFIICTLIISISMQ